MLTHYLMIALRNLLKNKAQSFIIIFGLALGLAACIIIMLVNHAELTRDAFWKDADKIYVVEQIGSPGQPDSHMRTLNAEVKHQIEDFFPEIRHSARLFSGFTPVTVADVDDEPKTFSEPVSQVDPEFLDIFHFDVVHGDIKKLSNAPNSVILSSYYASKYFGDSDALGRTITIDVSGLGSATGNPSSGDQRQDYSVIAVIDDTPYRTEIFYGIIIPYSDPAPTDNDDAENSTRTIYYNARTFIKLERADQLRHIEARLSDFMDSTYDRFFYNNRSPSEFIKLKLTGIAQTHLAAEGSQSPKERIWMLYLLAFIILAMASINTLNLTLAAYAQRQREVALRKTLGARRYEIFLQFWIDALLKVTAAFLLALILLEYLVPWLSAVLQLRNTRDFLYTGHFFTHLLFLVLILSLVIGCYPGIYLSRIKPALVLHTSRAHETLGSIRLRKFLVVIQFGMSAALIIAAGLVSIQLYKVMQYDPGYQTKNILYVYHHVLRHTNEGQFNNLKQQLQNLPGVLTVSATTLGIPGQDSLIAQVARGAQPIDQALALQLSFLTDSDQFLLFDIPLLAGRKVRLASVDPLAGGQPPNESVADSPAPIDEIIINLQAVKFLGFNSPEAAVNQTITQYSDNPERTGTPRKIVGVTDWLHLGTHDRDAAPTMFWMPNMNPMRYALGIRFRDGNRKAVEEGTQKIWQDIFGSSPNTWLLEDDIAKQYANQYTTAKFIYIFSAVAIVISTLGLYGLAALSAHKRTREIALRKLHGASAFNIIKMLAADFSKLVLIANILAWPLAFYAMDYWLQSFRLKIDLMVWGSVLAATALALALAIAWLTLTLQAWKVAQTKPADALREE